MHYYVLVLFFIAQIISNPLSAQTFRHYDYLGAGHQNEVTVVSGAANSLASKTIDGFNIQNNDQLKDASRFLAQCTFGSDISTIRMAAAMGYDAWLTEQFSLPFSPYSDEMVKHSYLYETAINPEGSVAAKWFRSAWINHNMVTPDLLRHRMAFTLSQIMVIANHTDLFDYFGQIGATYYDILANNAFDNYRGLISDVSLSPAVGLFLSHFRNPGADSTNNTHPDENYAREIMQLFSIGLWQLNTDGRRQYDSTGQFIPTYNNDDIKELAQVFTGLGDGRENVGFEYLSLHENTADIIQLPMRMYEEFHDNSEKKLPDGSVLPANQPGMMDINQTLDFLSGHPNAAPFISKALIQFFTTSNPSPAYIQRVSSIFDAFEVNNFQNVIKAILLDPEARDCNPTSTYTFGKLREPLVRYLNYLKAFPMTANENGDYLFFFECLPENMGQAPLEAPSVFNFFRPDYLPNNSIDWNYLVGPEFQILNSTKSVSTVNEMAKLAIHRAYFGECIDLYYGANPLSTDNPADLEYIYYADYSSELAMANDADSLINRLDLILANGLLQDSTKQIVKQAIEQLADPTDKVKMATYLIMISPDYAILK